MPTLEQEKEELFSTENIYRTSLSSAQIITKGCVVLGVCPKPCGLSHFFLELDVTLNFRF